MGGYFSQSALAQSQSQNPSSSLDLTDLSYQRAIRALSVGNYSQAEYLLEHITNQVPQHAGAWLDLALLYCQLGESANAEKIYQKIENDLQAPTGILQVIEQMRATGCAFELKWIKQAHVGFGRNSNVNFAPADSVIRFAGSAPFSELILGSANRPHSDLYALAELQTLLPASYNNIGGAQWQTLLQYKKHQSQSDHDILMAAIGARWTGFLGISQLQTNIGRHLPEYWEAGVQLNLTNMGGATYENSLFSWATLWSQERSEWLESKKAWRWGLEGGVSYNQYLQSRNYDALRLDLKLRQQWQLATKRVLNVFGFSVGPALDLAQKDRPGGDRHGYSALAESDTRWNTQHQTVAYIQHQLMRDKTPYSPTFFGVVARLPQATQWVIRHNYRLNLEHQIYAQYSQQVTKDSINLFSYNNQVLSIGYQWSF